MDIGVNKIKLLMEELVKHGNLNHHISIISLIKLMQVLNQTTAETQTVKILSGVTPQILKRDGNFVIHSLDKEMLNIVRVLNAMDTEENKV
jgi:hypothetical protein